MSYYLSALTYVHEQYLFPLMYLLLQRDLAIFHVAKRRILHKEELLDAADSLLWVLKAVNYRYMDLSSRIIAIASLNLSLTEWCSSLQTESSERGQPDEDHRVRTGMPLMLPGSVALHLTLCLVYSSTTCITRLHYGRGGVCKTLETQSQHRLLGTL